MTAGMLPARRVRRASFLPREVRTSAATVISFLTRFLLVARVKSVGPSGAYRGFTGLARLYPAQLNKQSANRSLFVYRPYGFRQQLGDRQRFNPARFCRLFRERNRICYYYLFQERSLDPLYC